MACRQRMKLNHSFDRLHGVYVIGSSVSACRASHGVQMELLLAEVLDVPIYSDYFDGCHVDHNIVIQPGNGILELVND